MTSHGSPALTGGKAASLARAATAGLATLPGVVLTTAFSDAVDGGADVARHPAVREAFERADGDRAPLVARSSSVVEDTAESSMAGQFDSVIGIDGFDEFVKAVAAVLDSRERAGAADQPIAVLVQPLIEPRFGGVMFGIDPVLGPHRPPGRHRGARRARAARQRRGRRLAVRARGAVGQGARVRRQRRTGAGAGRPPRASSRCRTRSRRCSADRRTSSGPSPLTHSCGCCSRARSRRRSAAYPGGPSTVRARSRRPSPSRSPSWNATSGSRRSARPSPRRCSSPGPPPRPTSTPATSSSAVDGHVAIDLRLAGEIKPKHTTLNKLNPIAASRNLRGAWRVGRLRAALPRLAEHLLDRIDADLEDVPPLTELTSRQLIGMLHRSRLILRALHAHEILMGMLTDTGGNRMTGASVALRVLAEARQDGLTDEEIIARSPVVLALTAPRVARAPVLPEEAVAVYAGDGLPELQRQRHPPRGAAAAGALGARGVGPRRLAAGRAAHVHRRPHRTRAHPAHDPRAPRGGRDQASGRGAGPRVEPHPRLRCAASRLVPAVRPGQADQGAVCEGGRRGHRRGWRYRQWAGHVRRRRSADRFGARHHDAVARARTAAAAPAGHRGRDGLGAVPPRDPRP